MTRKKPKLAHKLFFKNGTMAGVRVPYNDEFRARARAEGFAWVGRPYNYWREDERLLITGEPTTPEEISQAMQRRRHELADLVGEYFEFGEDETI